MSDENLPSVENQSIDQRLNALRADVQLLLSGQEGNDGKDYEMFEVVIEDNGVPSSDAKLRVGIYDDKYVVTLFYRAVPDDRTYTNYRVLFDRPEFGREHLVQQWCRLEEGSGYRTMSYNVNQYYSCDQQRYEFEGAPMENRIVEMMEQAMQYVLRGENVDSSLEVSGMAES